MRIWSTLLVAIPVATGLLAAPAAHAEHHGGDWHHPPAAWHGNWHHQDYGNGAGVAAAVLGLGAAAVLGGVLASQQPSYVPPPPVVYAPPPGYYAPPPGNYPPPGYYSQY